MLMVLKHVLIDDGIALKYNHKATLFFSCRTFPLLKMDDDVAYRSVLQIIHSKGCRFGGQEKLMCLSLSSKSGQALLLLLP
jgi:hypothetical protein